MGRARLYLESTTTTPGQTPGVERNSSLRHAARAVEEEIEEYIRRLVELKEQGANISLVQIYSADRPAARDGCGHLPLKTLSQIARRVKQEAGLNAEVF